MLYFEVILPLKLSFDPTYKYEGVEPLHIGSLVAVNFSGREYVGVVSKVHGGEYSPDPLVKPIERVEAEFPSITDEELLLWRQLSDYYLCPIGLVFKAAEKSLFETKSS